MGSRQEAGRLSRGREACGHGFPPKTRRSQGKQIQKSGKEDPIREVSGQITVQMPELIVGDPSMPILIGIEPTTDPWLKVSLRVPGTGSPTRLVTRRAIRRRKARNPKRSEPRAQTGPILIGMYLVPAAHVKTNRRTNKGMKGETPTPPTLELSQKYHMLVS